MKRLIYIALALSLAVACKSSHRPATDSEPTNATTEQTAKQLNFIPALAPAMLPQVQKMEYMREHYWDKFDFADTTFINQIDSTKMLTAFAVYATGYIPDSLAYKYMPRLMQRASTSKRMYTYFLMLAEGVLHDPNSPYRSDELYIAVLEAQIASPHYDRYEKMAPEYDLQIVRQNRIGHKANDFSYTVANGKSYRMYNVKSDFTIIYFNNPGCTLCRDITNAMKESAIITEMVRKGRLKVLAIYPDEQLDEWHKHRADIPSAWINGYDKGALIDREKLYNVNAIPAIYLLDKQKMVLVKDSIDVGEVERVLSQMN